LFRKSITEDESRKVNVVDCLS